jgi:RNA polymerase sigma-70 factor (ECF subfamily)
MMRREAVETAVSRIAELPTMQRSVVVLKDVLDQSLEAPRAVMSDQICDTLRAGFTTDASLSRSLVRRR